MRSPHDRIAAAVILFVVCLRVVPVLAVRRILVDDSFETSSFASRRIRSELRHPDPPQEDNKSFGAFSDGRLLASDSSSSLYATPTDPTEHLVTSLPYLDPETFTTEHYAGHLPASSDPNDKKLFYWLFAPDFTENTKTANPENAPLLIWLNGGPGCSSMDGLFLENGPFRLVYNKDDHDDTKSSWTIQINPHSWHKSPAYVLYVDQPVGTGLSFTKKEKYCKNDLEIDIDFHYFLEEFLLLHRDTFLTKHDVYDDKWKLKRKLYFSGESHAGHYIPSMIDHILKRNDEFHVPEEKEERGTAGDDNKHQNNDPNSSSASKSSLPRVEIPVSGAAIGNGWVDPYHQYAVATAAYGMGLIDLAQKSNLDQMEQMCQSSISAGDLQARVCFDLLDKVIDQSYGSNGKYKVSQYDNRQWENKHSPREFPPGHRDVEAYLGGGPTGFSSPKMDVDYTQVLKAIHAEESIDAKQRYQECTDPPYNALKHQDGLGVVSEVVRILEHPTNVNLLFFNGMNDIICNHVGNEMLLDSLPWSKVDKWMLAKRYAWDGGTGASSSTTSSPAGYVKEYENLIFLKILDSGHMVPMDQPLYSLTMMRTFMLSESGSFRTSEQQLLRKTPEDVAKDGGKCEPCPACDVPSPGVATGDGDGGDDNVASGVDQPKQKASSSSDTMIEKGPVNRFVIIGGWMGASVALLALFLVTYARGRRTRSRGVLVQGDEYGYDVEMEDTSLPRTGRHTSRYRDDPVAAPGVRGGAVNGSIRTGGSSHSSTSSGIV